MTRKSGFEVVDSRKSAKNVVGFGSLKVQVGYSKARARERERRRCEKRNGGGNVRVSPNSSLYII